MRRIALSKPLIPFSHAISEPLLFITIVCVHVHRNTAGNVFKKYYITHAGLGVWDTTDDVKFTIEFVSESYVGALLPDFNDATSQLVWENGGKVVFTTPTVDSDWLESQLVCDTSGNAYTQLVTYLQTNTDVFQYYQPVEVVYYNASSNVLNNTDYSSDQLQASGNLKVSKQDSFWFANILINQLSTYGATVESYLTIYATSFQYLSLYDVAPGVVSWEPDGPTNADVYRWYQALSACYQSNYDITAASELGGEYFLNVSVYYMLLCLILCMLRVCYWYVPIVAYVRSGHATNCRLHCSCLFLFSCFIGLCAECEELLRRLRLRVPHRLQCLQCKSLGHMLATTLYTLP